MTQQNLDPLRVKALALYELLLRSPSSHLFFDDNSSDPGDFYAGEDIMLFQVDAEAIEALRKMGLVVQVSRWIWIPAPQKIL